MKYLLICLLLISTSLVKSGDLDSVSHRHFLIPDYAKTQFAGNIGFLSIGPGYWYASKKMELDIMYGFVPKNAGGVLHSLTLKNTWIPFKKICVGKNTELDPLTLGIPLSYTFGKQFFFIAPQDQYPKRYYDYSSALRVGVFAGGKVRQKLSPSYLIKEASLYYELGTYDLLIHNYIIYKDNMRFGDIFSLGLGLQFSF